MEKLDREGTFGNAGPRARQCWVPRGGGTHKVVIHCLHKRLHQMHKRHTSRIKDITMCTLFQVGLIPSQVRRRTPLPCCVGRIFVENKMGPTSKNYQLYPFFLMYTHGTLPQSTHYNLSAFYLTSCISIETNLFANTT